MRFDRSGVGQWHPWFAWHPVKVAPMVLVWLETVERRRCLGFWDYRCKAKD
jgi:hypothetical protein